MNVWARFLERFKNNTNVNKEEFDSGISNLYSAIRAYTAHYIVGAPFCTYWLNGGSRYVTSRESSTLLCLKLSLGEEIEGIMRRVKGEIIHNSYLYDFVFRPRTPYFEQMGFYFFVSWYKRRDIKKRGKNDILFAEEHPLYEHQCLHKRKRMAVPEILWRN